MKYINITTTTAVFSFTNDLPEFDSIEFTVSELYGNVKVSIKLGYKIDNLAFSVDLAVLKYVYGDNNVTVTNGEEDNTGDIPF